jgi:hypothetical protein
MEISAGATVGGRLRLMPHFRHFVGHKPLCANCTKNLALNYEGKIILF